MGPLSTPTEDVELAALEDANGDLQDAESLRRRIRRDGYAFFPGLLDPSHVSNVRELILQAVGALGWTEPGTNPLEALPSSPGRHAGEDRWWEGYVAIQKIEAWHQLAYEPRLLKTLELILEDVLVLPVKIARVTYPSLFFPTPPHQDYFFIGGNADTFTAWIPLGSCPGDLGGLQVLPGSHHGGLRPVEPAVGAGGVSANLDARERCWRTADYQPGDVLVFHSLLVHRAPQNKGRTLRLSTDYRYQRVDAPLNPGALFPHAFQTGHMPFWNTLTEGWSTDRWISTPPWVHVAQWSSYRDPHPYSRFASPDSEFTKKATP